jgi:hypothetical protein
MNKGIIQLFNNYSVQIDSRLESGKIVRIQDTLIIPDDGTIYAIAFINGVTDESIEAVCNIAKSRIENFIKRGAEKCILQLNKN